MYQSHALHYDDEEYHEEEMQQKLRLQQHPQHQQKHNHRQYRSQQQHQQQKNRKFEYSNDKQQRRNLSLLTATIPIKFDLKLRLESLEDDPELVAKEADLILEGYLEHSLDSAFGGFYDVIVGYVDLTVTTAEDSLPASVLSSEEVERGGRNLVLDSVGHAGLQFYNTSVTPEELFETVDNVLFDALDKIDKVTYALNHKKTLTLNNAQVLQVAMIDIDSNTVRSPFYDSNNIDKNNLNAIKFGDNNNNNIPSSQAAKEVPTINIVFASILIFLTVLSLIGYAFLFWKRRQNDILMNPPELIKSSSVKKKQDNSLKCLQGRRSLRGVGSLSSSSRVGNTNETVPDVDSSFECNTSYDFDSVCSGMNSQFEDEYVSVEQSVTPMDKIDFEKQIQLEKERQAMITDFFNRTKKQTTRNVSSSPASSRRCPGVQQMYQFPYFDDRQQQQQQNDYNEDDSFGFEIQLGKDVEWNSSKETFQQGAGGGVASINSTKNRENLSRSPFISPPTAPQKTSSTIRQSSPIPIYSIPVVNNQQGQSSPSRTISPMTVANEYIYSGTRRIQSPSSDNNDRNNRSLSPPLSILPEPVTTFASSQLFPSQLSSSSAIINHDNCDNTTTMSNDDIFSATGINSINSSTINDNKVDNKVQSSMNCGIIADVEDIMQNMNNKVENSNEQRRVRNLGTDFYEDIIKPAPTNNSTTSSLSPNINNNSGNLGISSSPIRIANNTSGSRTRMCTTLGVPTRTSSLMTDVGGFSLAELEDEIDLQRVATAKKSNTTSKLSDSNSNNAVTKAVKHIENRNKRPAVIEHHASELESSTIMSLSTIMAEDNGDASALTDSCFGNDASVTADSLFSI